MFLRIAALVLLPVGVVVGQSEQRGDPPDAPGPAPARLSDEPQERGSSRGSDPSTFIAAARELSRRSACSLCKGEGAVSKKVRIGERPGALPGMTEDVYADIPHRCEKCDGSTLGDPQAVQRLAIAVARRLSALSPEDPKLDRAIELAGSELRTCAARFLQEPEVQVVEGPPTKTGTRVTRRRPSESEARRQRDGVAAAHAKWQQRFNDPAISALRRSKPPIGEPVVMIGNMAAAGVGESGMQRVEVAGGLTIELLDTRLMDAFPGDPVLIGGTHKSSTRRAGGSLVATLEHGFVVTGKP